MRLILARKCDILKCNIDNCRKLASLQNKDNKEANILQLKILHFKIHPGPDTEILYSIVLFLPFYNRLSPEQESSCSSSQTTVGTSA